MGKTKREVVTEFRTGELLAAARTVFAEKGFDGATIEDVAAAAGVAKGTVYLYYRSKQELYGAVFREGMLALHRATTERVQAAPDLEAKIRAFVTTKLAYFDEHREFFRIYFEAFGSARAVHPDLQAEFDALYREQVQMLEAAIRSAVEARRVPQAPAGRGGVRDLRPHPRPPPPAHARLVERWPRGRCRVRSSTSSGRGSQGDDAGQRRRSPGSRSRRRMIATVAGAATAPSPPSAGGAQVVRLTLADAIARGLEYNLGVVAGAQRVREAEGARRVARAALLPQLSFGAMQAREEISYEAYGLPVAPGTSPIVGPFDVAMPASTSPSRSST